MEFHGSRRRCVVAAVALDGASLVALMRASFLARQFGDELRVLHVVWHSEALSALQEEASARVVMEWALAGGVLLGRESVEIRAGSPDIEITRAVSEPSTRLAVLGGVGAGDSSPPGRIARFVARNASVPVMVSAPPSPSRRIVAASDLRDDRYPVLDAAAALAVALGARATAVHNAGPAVHDPHDRRARLERGVARAPCYAEALLTRELTPLDGIGSVARLVDADVIVVGLRHGHGDTFASLLASERRSVVAVPISA